MTIPAIIVLTYLFLKLIRALFNDGIVVMWWSPDAVNEEKPEPMFLYSMSFYRELIWISIVFGVLYSGGFFSGNQ